VTDAATPGGPAVRIAMWSGPRNLSTAMMRAWESRPDTAVVDEPFYACFLSRSSVRHPLREAVLAAQATDWHAVIETLTGEAPDGAGIFYQKHMTHHMLPEAPLEWTSRVRNAFLIRHPGEVAASWARAMRAPPTLGDLGYVRQAEIFDFVTDLKGSAPPVVDAADVLADPAAALGALCAALDVRFDEHMLSWPPGPRATDGIWASHWYRSVWRSTGFSEPGVPADPAPELMPVIDAALPYYERLARHRLAGGET
jgi:hypothetical protein